MDTVKIIAISVGVLALIFVIYVTYCITKYNNSKKRILEWMKEKKLKADKTFEFFNGNFGYSVYADETHEILVIHNVMRDVKQYIKFSDIRRCEVLENARPYEEGRTLKKVTRLELVIFTNDSDRPEMHIVLEGDKVRPSSADYQRKLNFARRVGKYIEEVA